MAARPLSISIVFLLLGFSAPVAAGPIEDALLAYDQGDNARALQQLRTLAVQGNAKAQFKLAEILAFGRDRVRNETEAMMWYSRAAELGDADAQFTLGYKSAGARSGALAVKWFTLAAAQGHAEAQYRLGDLYRRGQGEGVPQDYGEALRWYQLAANQGHPFAEVNLGEMYVTGQGVPQDYVRGHMWLNLSAAKGIDRAGRNRKKHDACADR